MVEPHSAYFIKFRTKRASIFSRGDYSVLSTNPASLSSVEWADAAEGSAGV
jgi:hypothetical protein